MEKLRSGARLVMGGMIFWVGAGDHAAVAGTRSPATPEVERQVAKAFPGWEVEALVEGDLNGDQTKDVVVTLKQPEGKVKLGDSGPAWLAVFFRTTTGELHLHTTAKHAVCVGCGGMKGGGPDDVVGTPTIDRKGILMVEYEGGSREIWNFRLKWRYDKGTNHFALIGETYASADTLSDDHEGERGSVSSQDINYLNGKMRRKVVGQRERTCDVKPGFAISDLTKFDFDKFVEVEEKHVKGSCKP